MREKNHEKWGGYSDWRLPSIQELHTLFTLRKDMWLEADADGIHHHQPDLRNANDHTPWIDHALFQLCADFGKAKHSCWSSTCANGQGWVAYFGDAPDISPNPNADILSGGYDGLRHLEQAHYARLVRTLSASERKRWQTWINQFLVFRK